MLIYNVCSNSIRKLVKYLVENGTDLNEKRLKKR